MFEKITKILQWASIPVLSVVALLSALAGRYEGRMSLAICLSAVVLVQRAVWLKEYGWVGMWVVVFVVFSPLPPVAKLFLLMALTSVAACLAVVVSLRRQPVAAL